MENLLRSWLIASWIGVAGQFMGAADEASPPNILWICTDQQRFDTIHSLGNPHLRIPIAIMCGRFFSGRSEIAMVR